MAQIDIVNPRVTIMAGRNSILAREGTSLVIHAKADDYHTQPAGGAGDRIACGEIKSPPETKPVIK